MRPLVLSARPSSLENGCKMFASMVKQELHWQYLGIGHQSEKLISVSTLGEADNHVILGDNPQITMQGICGVEIDRLAARGYKRLGDLLSNEAALAHSCEKDDSLALQAGLQPRIHIVARHAGIGHTSQI